MSSSSQQQNIAKKTLRPLVHNHLILSVQYSPACLQTRKPQLLNHMPCSACSRYFSRMQLCSSGWYWDDTAELKSKDG